MKYRLFFFLLLPSRIFLSTQTLPSNTVHPYYATQVTLPLPTKPIPPASPPQPFPTPVSLPYSTECTSQHPSHIRPRGLQATSSTHAYAPSLTSSHTPSLRQSQLGFNSTQAHNGTSYLSSYRPLHLVAGRRVR